MGERRTLLVANRGEIAVRIFATCRRLGIRTAAVAGPATQGALHTRVADTAVHGRLVPRRRRARGCRREAGADLVHPGYGFLAESAAFAEAVVAAGLTWVGPSPEVLRRGGDKLEAKRIAAAAGVPDARRGRAGRARLPLLVKAAAGGGGRGMRVVERAEDLDEALAAASREAEAAFGDGAVFCERYLERPRHVEVQLIGDRHGTVLALGERDCSVQRRHQKVVEESPPPGLPRPCAHGSRRTPSLRARRRLRERGDGRVPRRRTTSSFFLELNAPDPGRAPGDRGGDGPGPRRAPAPGRRRRAARPVSGAVAGHAVEARLYAEDPRTLPAAARHRRRLGLPAAARVDAGVEEGDEVGGSYDPMIAKLIVHGADRTDALDRLAGVLDETIVEGVTTNLPFLRWLVAHPAFRDCRPFDRLPGALSAPLLSPAARSGRPVGGRDGGSTWRRRRGLPPLEVESAAHAGRSAAATGASPLRCPAR